MQVLLSIITPGITSLILLTVKSDRLSPLLHEPVYSVASLSALKLIGLPFTLVMLDKHFSMGHKYITLFIFFPLKFNFYFGGKREQLDTS